MARIVRNLAGVQFEALRRVIDQPFHDFKDELEEAFYGARLEDGSLDKATGWSSGISKPFRGFDKQATLKESKVLFDHLHGALFMFYTLVLHDENVAQGLPFAREQIDRPIPSRIAEGIIKLARAEKREITAQELRDINTSLMDSAPNTVVEQSRKRFRDLRASDPTIFSMLKTWADEQGFGLDPDRTD